MAVAGQSKKQAAQTLADDDRFIKKVAQTLEKELPGDEEFITKLAEELPP